MPRRSYDQYCPLARALDMVGERWTLLIIRELLAGPRRYTDLHADLPGVSTDMLASRLKEMERDGLVVRRKVARPFASWVYELTPRATALLPALTALADWGAEDLDGQRPTDARRGHWFALPLMRELSAATVSTGVSTGVIDVQLDDGSFHIVLGDTGPAYRHGPAEVADATLSMDASACLDVSRGTASLRSVIKDGRAVMNGSGPLREALADQVL
jgi:DNA-binding HxlR family transcriptional regulator